MFDGIHVIRGDGVGFQGFEAGDDRFGVDDRAGPTGVGRAGKEQIDRVLVEEIVFAGDEFVEVNKARAFGGGDVLRPARLRGGIADGFAIGVPPVARDEGADDGGGAFGASLGNELANICLLYTSRCV